LELYKNNPEFVVPKKRLNEISKFVESGLEDFSISRLKSKMEWGIEIPGDSEHVMYVWFDALVNYISCLGWPNGENFEKFWPGIQVAGKDNLRQQSAMWQAMLMSANISNSKQIFIDGFINVDGKKMSKSLGNVIAPHEMVEKFGTDGTRYLLLSFGNFGEDMDITWEKLTEKFNADLANGLGNLVSRVIKLSENSKFQIPNFKSNPNEQISNLIDKMELGKALNIIWDMIREANKFIEDNKPWELKKNDEQKFREVMQKLVNDLDVISELLIAFLPETSQKIKTALENKKTEILFQRINTN